MQQPIIYTYIYTYIHIYVFRTWFHTLTRLARLRITLSHELSVPTIQFHSVCQSSPNTCACIIHGMLLRCRYLHNLRTSSFDSSSNCMHVNASVGTKTGDPLTFAVPLQQASSKPHLLPHRHLVKPRTHGEKRLPRPFVTMRCWSRHQSSLERQLPPPIHADVRFNLMTSSFVAFIRLATLQVSMANT